MRSTRRTFLKVTGLTAALPLASQATAGEPTTDGGPGRIDDLSAYLENPEQFEENREPTTATATIPYESAGAARDADERFAPLEERFGESAYVRLLNGDWDFQFFTSPGRLPSSFDPTSDNWDTVTVPEPWQTQGYDERIYTNWQPTWVGYSDALAMGWEAFNDALNPGVGDGELNVPGVGDDRPDPVGVYNRTVSVPADWDGRELFLRFEGVKQAYFVWVDGEYVGFQQGSMTPGEFDVTEHVTPGRDHELTVQVYRWSDAEALECTDMHKYAGIYRSVYLYATPRVHVRDFHVRQELDDEYEDATLRVDAEVTNYGDGGENSDGDGGTGARARSGAHTVRGTLYDPDGNRVTTLSTDGRVGDDGFVASMEADLSDPAKWTAEHPNLYTLALELVPAGADDATEAFVEKVGFREYEVDRGHRGAQVRVNGRPVNVRGANRHEVDPETGRTVSVDVMRTDIELMKRFNLNTVRTSHYPNDPTFLRLADEYGLYVVDEANCETHWHQPVLAETTAYHEQAVARFRRMVLRDRNHASVCAWSTGNEAGTAAEHLEMAGVAVGSDDEHVPTTTGETRLPKTDSVETFDGDVEGLAGDRLLYHQPNIGGWEVAFCDMLGPRYISVESMVSLAADGKLTDSPRFGTYDYGDPDRPVVMGEYNHAFGNSLGLVGRFWNEYIQPPVRRARDESGTGDADDGVLVGAPVVRDADDGGALVLGPDDRVTVDAASDLAFDEPGFSLAVSVEGLDADTATEFVSKAGAYRLAAAEGGRVEFSVGDGAASVSARVPTDAADDDGPHTLVGVCRSGALDLYLDGSRVGRTDHSLSTVESGDAPVHVGGGDAGTGRSVTYHAVRAFDRALSADAAGSPADAEGAVLAYTFEALLRDASLQGGFVWEWSNQSLNAVTDDGQEYQFYDREGPAGAFCLNGMVWVDRDVQPELRALKQCHQPVKVAARDPAAGEVYVTNHHGFTDVSDLDATWELVRDGTTVRSGDLSLDVPPGATRPATLDGFEMPSSPEPGADYRLELSFALPEATAWAEADHEVAFAQFEVPVEASAPETVDPAEMPPVSVRESEECVVVSGDGFEYAFDRDAGTLSSMCTGGTEHVERGPLLDFWRAPVMNESTNWGGNVAESWYDMGLDDIRHAVDGVDVARASERVVDVIVRGRAFGAAAADPGYETTYRYRVFGSGDVTVDVEAEPNDALVDGVGEGEWLPKVGLQVEAVDRFTEFEWYGRGPEETYPDRTSGSRVGRYAGTVEDQFVPYVPPTDNGNKAETRWAALSDGSAGLAAFAGDGTMNVNLNRWSNLADADYVYELEERGSVALNLDHAVTGVGGTPVPPFEEYRVRPEPVSFSVTLRPLGEDEDPMELADRRLPTAGGGGSDT